MPDLNSLPASATSSTSTSPMAVHSRTLSFGHDNNSSGPPSPRSPSLSSLQAAAAINAGLHRTPSNASHGRSPYIQRRRSSLMNNISLNDPAIPAPGEMQANTNPLLRRSSFRQDTADPNHQRQPSLGELHQELENEQEAQVNRLLHMIRAQQNELTALHRQQQGQVVGTDPNSTASGQTHVQAEPSSTASPNVTGANEQNSPVRSSISAIPSQGRFYRTQSLSRPSSSQRTRSPSGSPAPLPSSSNTGPPTEDWLLGGSRDECAFYQAETQMLTRENQMLKLRIRELEKQITDLGAAPTSNQPNPSVQAHAPRQHSPLTNPQVDNPNQVASLQSLPPD